MFLRVSILAAALLCAGCTTTRVTETPRSRLEQRLFLKAVARAVRQLDVAELAGREVLVEMDAVPQDEGLDYSRFVGDYIEVWLESNGAHVVHEAPQAELRFRVFANVLAVDHGDYLIGTPDFTILGVPIPALSAYRLQSNRGYAELKAFVFDERSGRLQYALPACYGYSYYDEHLAFLLIGWTTTDLEEP
jgi:hypothetical protein